MIAEDCACIVYIISRQLRRLSNMDCSRKYMHILIVANFWHYKRNDRGFGLKLTIIHWMEIISNTNFDDSMNGRWSLLLNLLNLTYQNGKYWYFRVISTTLLGKVYWSIGIHQCWSENDGGISRQVVKTSTCNFWIASCCAKIIMGLRWIAVSNVNLIVRWHFVLNWFVWEKVNYIFIRI